MHSITKNKGKKSKSKQSWTTTYGHWSGGLVWCCIVLKLSFSWALLFWLSLSRVTREFYRFPQWRRAACGESWRIGRNHTSLATCIGYVVFDPEQPKAHKLNKLYIHFNILALTSMLHVRTLLTKYCKHCRSWLLSFYVRWQEKTYWKLTFFVQIIQHLQFIRIARFKVILFRYFPVLHFGGFGHKYELYSSRCSHPSLAILL